MQTAILLVAIAAAQACNSPDGMRAAGAGRALAAQKKYDAAALEFRRALDTCPEQRPLLLELAQVLTFQRKFTEAKEAVKQFLAADPASEPALVVLANIHFMAQELPDCHAVLKRILDVNPKSIPALKIKANAHYLAGEEQDAVGTFEKILELDSKSEDTLYSLGRIYYQQNRFDLAIAQFKRVLELDPKNYRAWDNLGLCYEGLNNDGEAARHYLKAIELVYKDAPNYDWAYANFANLLLKRGDYSKAFTLAAEAAQRNPASARNFFLTGKALVRLGKPDTSVKWLKRSTELDPNYPDPWYLLGQVHAKLGQKEDSERAFKMFQEVSAKAPRVRR